VVMLRDGSRPRHQIYFRLQSLNSVCVVRSSSMSARSDSQSGVAMEAANTVKARQAGSQGQARCRGHKDGHGSIFSGA
jgi:hypothetical protein